MKDPDLQADITFAAGPDGDGPSTKFKRSDDRHTVELACCRCGEQLIFTPNTKFEEIKRAMEKHRCTPTALRVPTAIRRGMANAN